MLPQAGEEGTMTKAELVERISKDAKISKKAAETALDSFMANVRDALKKGKRVSLVGFGTFAVGRRAARNGRNPQTGETIKIKAAKVPKFKAGKILKDAVR
jgi:DNA-binding protein HU-beta